MNWTSELSPERLQPEKLEDLALSNRRNRFHHAAGSSSCEASHAIVAADCKGPLILREKESLTRTIIDEKLRAAGTSANCLMEIETTEGLKRAVAEGLGCSFAPRCSVEAEAETGVLTYHRTRGVRMTREFRVIMHKAKSLSGPIKPFLDLLTVRAELAYAPKTSAAKSG